MPFYTDPTVEQVMNDALKKCQDLTCAQDVSGILALHRENLADVIRASGMAQKEERTRIFLDEVSIYLSGISAPNVRTVLAAGRLLSILTRALVHPALPGLELKREMALSFVQSAPPVMMLSTRDLNIMKARKAYASSLQGIKDELNGVPLPSLRTFQVAISVELEKEDLQHLDNIMDLAETGLVNGDMVLNSTSVFLPMKMKNQVSGLKASVDLLPKGAAMAYAELKEEIIRHDPALLDVGATVASAFSLKHKHRTYRCQSSGAGTVCLRPVPGLPSFQDLLAA